MRSSSPSREMQRALEAAEFIPYFQPVVHGDNKKWSGPTPITLQLFEQLHELGVMIAIDDFGTGHSSLGYLRQFNVDFLKIDQSFVAMIGVDALSRHMLDTIIELSAKLDLGIVAERVETEEQSDYLTVHGVSFLQGYLFGRPIPGAEFVNALSHH